MSLISIIRNLLIFRWLSNLFNPSPKSPYNPPFGPDHFTDFTDYGNFTDYDLDPEAYEEPDDFDDDFDDDFYNPAEFDDFDDYSNFDDSYTDFDPDDDF